MGDFRRVSAVNDTEAREVIISGTTGPTDGKFGITTGNIAAWPTECDFITYERDSDNIINEASRVVWIGTKVSDTYIEASRVGGSSTHVTAGGEYATMVPSHYWANSLVDQLNRTLASDGKPGVKGVNNVNYLIHAGASQPAAVAGRTIIWLKPMV
jgi:hypothetical protein